MGISKVLALTILIGFALQSSAKPKDCSELFAKVQKSFAGDLLDYAEETGSQLYIYPSYGDRYLPVVAMQKSKLKKYMADFGKDTIAFVYRSDVWHSYVRIGDTLIDMEVKWYDEEPDRDYKSVNFRKAESVFRKSKSTEWKEGVLRLDKKTVQMMYWFFIYRSEFFKMRNKNKFLDSPWDMEFASIARNYETQESCALFANSPFQKLFHENLPSKAEQDQLRVKATAFGKSKKLSMTGGKAPTLLSVVKHLKAATKKYGLDKFPSGKIKSTQGQLRMVNVHPNALGFVIHNSDYEGFVKDNKMGFTPRASSGAPIDQAFDHRTSERISLEELE